LNTKTTEDAWTSADLQHFKKNPKEVQAEKTERQIKKCSLRINRKQ